MTLKENFDSISCNDCDMPFCEIKCTMLSDSELNKLEQIADDYAIEFFDWCNELRMHGKGYYENSTKQLLEIFKKEKGL